MSNLRLAEIRQKHVAFDIILILVRLRIDDIRKCRTTKRNSRFIKFKEKNLLVPDARRSKYSPIFSILIHSRFMLP